MADPYFAENAKMIPALVKVLNQILKWNAKAEDNGGQSDIHWRFFYDRLGKEYAFIISRLEEEQLGLLQVERAGRGEKKGDKCYGYRLTEKCLPLLLDTNREYLHKVLTDKATKRKVQKRVSGRGYWKKVPYDDVRDEIKATIDGITLKEEEINSLCDCYTPEKAAHAYLVLIEILEKDYGDLKHNEADNRVPNPYTQLPAEVKSLIEVNGLRYITTYDIRSAYPSMWAHWIQSLHPELEEIKEEKAAYEAIFLDPARSPKEYLAETLGISGEEMKDVMIQYFNGRRFRRSRNDPFFKFDSWLKSGYPKLYALWKQTDIKQTGNQIGKHFETKLMLDRTIFQKARSLGFAIGYENDGFSVFGNVAKEHPSVKQLLDFVSEQSVRLLGIKLVIVTKLTPKWNPSDVLKESYEKRADTLWENWDLYRRRFYRLLPERRDWNEYDARKGDVRAGLERCVRVLERLQAQV